MRTTEPMTVTQGEKIEWTRSFTDYPATEWTLQYRFRGPDTGFNIAGVANGTAFDATLSSAASAAADVGTWKWQAWMTNIADPSIVLMADAGVTKILRGFPVTTGEIELRSPAKIMLDTLDAALQASGSDVVEYEISTPAGSRRVKRSSRKEALELRGHYAGIVARENGIERVRSGGRYGVAVNLRLHD